MAKSLEDLREILLQGQLRSGKGTYEHKLPARRAVPDLFEAQTGLRGYTRENPDDEAGWRLCAQAEECLTNYTAAIRCLERAMGLSGQRSRKDLKVLARLREHAAESRRKKHD
jgi:hypothetical protein